MNNGDSKMNNYTIKICTDHVIKDPEETKRIIERVSKIVSNSYRRKGASA